MVERFSPTEVDKLQRNYFHNVCTSKNRLADVAFWREYLMLSQKVKRFGSFYWTFFHFYWIFQMSHYDFYYCSKKCLSHTINGNQWKNSKFRINLHFYRILNFVKWKCRTTTDLKFDLLWIPLITSISTVFRMWKIRSIARIPSTRTLARN